MRQSPTYFLSVLLSLLCMGAAVAWQPGPDIIRECPKCGMVLEQATMMSGNTFGARFWTDGKIVAPMLPDRPWLVQCPKCSTLFWIDEAKQLGEQTKWDNHRDWPNAVKPTLPTETDFLSLLGGAKLPEKKELYLRWKAWWTANDAVRTNDSATVTWSSAQEANLQALANLMDEKNPDQRITKAEILRELKKFDDCIRLLKQPFEKEHHAEVAAFIRGLAEQKTPTVREIKDEKKPNQPSEGTR